jgi:hypothetical protein
VDYIGPDTGQACWRDLFELLRVHKGDQHAGEVIWPWADRHLETIRELRDIGRPQCRGARIRCHPGQYDPLQGMYALSRVLDVLIAPYQPAHDDPALLNWVTGQPWWTGRLPGRPALPALAAAIGCARISEEDFSPFFHEIVAVEQADDPDASPQLAEEVWPGFMVGSMMLVRAGTVVRAGANIMNPLAASQSRMYWAWWRRNRRPADLSHGWGSNSQWRTDFRRDYFTDGALHYNVDGYRHKRDGGLPGPAARELVRFRCNILRDLGDQWPYGHRLSEPYH